MATANENRLPRRCFFIEAVWQGPDTSDAAFAAKQALGTAIFQRKDHFNGSAVAAAVTVCVEQTIPASEPAR